MTQIRVLKEKEKYLDGGYYKQLRVTYNEPQEGGKLIAIRDFNNAISYAEERNSAGFAFVFDKNNSKIVTGIDLNEDGQSEQEEGFYTGECMEMVVEDKSKENSMETIQLMEGEEDLKSLPHVDNLNPKKILIRNPQSKLNPITKVFAIIQNFLGEGDMDGLKVTLTDNGTNKISVIVSDKKKETKVPLSSTEIYIKFDDGKVAISSGEESDPSFEDVFKTIRIQDTSNSATNILRIDALKDGQFVKTISFTDTNPKNLLIQEYDWPWPSPQPKPDEPQEDSTNWVDNDVIWDSNKDGKWDNGVKRIVKDKEGNTGPNGLGLYTAASGDPVLEIQGDGIARLTCKEGHGRIYVCVSNYNSLLEYEFNIESKNIANVSTKLRSRHQAGGACENRFGGFGHAIGIDHGVDFQTEICHNKHENKIIKELPKELEIGKWYKQKIQVNNSEDNKSVLFTNWVDYGDGNGFVKVLGGSHKNPKDFYLDKALFEKESYFWLRLNIDKGSGSVQFKNVRLMKLP